MTSYSNSLGRQETLASIRPPYISNFSEDWSQQGGILTSTQLFCKSQETETDIRLIYFKFSEKLELKAANFDYSNFFCKNHEILT